MRIACSKASYLAFSCLALSMILRSTLKSCAESASASSFYIVRCRYTSCSIVLADSKDLSLVDIRPAPLNTYSDSTEVAGTDIIFNPNWNRQGYTPAFAAQKTKGSRYSGCVRIVFFSCSYNFISSSIYFASSLTIIAGSTGYSCTQLPNIAFSRYNSFLAAMLLALCSDP